MHLNANLWNRTAVRQGSAGRRSAMRCGVLGLWIGTGRAECPAAYRLAQRDWSTDGRPKRRSGGRSTDPLALTGKFECD